LAAVSGPQLGMATGEGASRSTSSVILAVSWSISVVRSWQRATRVRAGDETATAGDVLVDLVVRVRG
jgi:hypothetical protein